MNQDTILGIVRHSLTFGGGFLVQHSLATSDQIAAGAAAVVTLIGLVWSIIKNKKSTGSIPVS